MGSPTTGDERMLTIEQVAERAGLNTSHIRFYERVRVLPAPERVAGQRRYREEVPHPLSIIEVAQRAGLTLEEIAPLTGPGNRGADVCGLFVKPTLLPPVGDIDLDVRHVRAADPGA